MKSLSVVFLSLLVALSLAAQTPQTGAKQPDAKAKPAEKPPAATKTADAKQPDWPPKPAPEMERLTKLLQGRWQTDEKHEASPMLPQGGTGKGQEGIRPGPGKLSLIGEYTSQGPMGEFAGIGIITWSAADRTYTIHWTDNTNPAFVTMTGKWQGDELVFTGSDTMMGKKVYSRHAYTELKPDSFTYTIDEGPAPTQLKRAMTIKYTRINMSDIMNQRMKNMRGPQPQ